MRIAKQQGFTLIELVMVIVVLGILAATALPKFADLSGSARTATLDAAMGATKSAMGIVYAQSLIEGEASASGKFVVIQGATINTDYGYPTLAKIGAAAGLGDFTVNTTSGLVSVNDSAGAAIANCSFKYTAATSAAAPATVDTRIATGC